MPETGISGAFSQQFIVAQTRGSRLVGQVFVLEQGGELSLSATLDQVRSSRQWRLRMDSAWKDGTELAFSAPGRREPFCIANGQCLGYRTGTFAFSPAEFERAGQEGFGALVLGPDEGIEVNYPAHLFTEAMEHARRLGLRPS